MQMFFLDAESVLTFVLVSEYRSFTRVAQVLNSTQSAISTRVRRLEDQLGVRLVERSTRSVQLSSQGEAFLQPARDFLAAHDKATAVFSVQRPQLKIGISHHLVGADVSRLLAGLARENPDLVVSLTVDGSQGLMTRYDDGELDAVFLLRHKTTRRFGETIGTVRFQWFGVAALTENADQAIPLVTYPAGCNMRAMTIEVLEDAGIAWREAFIGVSAANLKSAVKAGYGVAALCLGAHDDDLPMLADQSSLPVLPQRDIMLLSKISSYQARKGLEVVKDAVASLG